MDKPAIIRTLEADPRMLDFAGAAMYKIREPNGSKLRAFEHITAGKQKRNRELALSVINQVLEKYPDPKQVRTADDVKDYMADVMYRTLAPNKSEHFPLDQRTPFARAYYRAKAESFFYDFLSPLTDYSKAGLPVSSSGQLDSSGSITLPSSSARRQSHKQVSGPQSRGSQLQTGHTPKKPVVESSVQRPQVRARSPKPESTSPVPTAQPDSSFSSQAALVGCLVLIIVVLVVVLLVQSL